MARVDWTLESARNRVAKCGGAVVAGKKITVTPGGVGIGTYGAIDYLCSKQGFIVEIQRPKST